MKKARKFLPLALVLMMVTVLFGGVGAFADSAAVKSDSPYNLSIPQSNSYTIKFTVSGTAKGAPTFKVGNGSILQTSLKKIGANYYFKVTAAGKEGDSTGVYSQMPGQAAVCQAVVKITEKVQNLGFVSDQIGTTFGGDPCNEKVLAKMWTGSFSDHILWGEDEFDNTPVTVTNSNPDVLELSIGGTVSGTSFQASTTPSGQYEKLSQGLWDISDLADQDYFECKGKKAGTATVTISVKSPKTGVVQTITEVWTVYDSSDAVIKSDTPSHITLKRGASYTFKVTASSEAVSQGINFFAEGDIYGKDAFGQEGSCGTVMDCKVTGKGNGVYYITVPASIPKGTPSGYYLKPGTEMELEGRINGLDNQTICTIKIA